MPKESVNPTTVETQQAKKVSRRGLVSMIGAGGSAAILAGCAGLAPSHDPHPFTIRTHHQYREKRRVEASLEH